MQTRREFVHWAGAALGGSCLAATGGDAGALGLDLGPGQGTAVQPKGSSPPKTGSDIGSLFPFVQSQAIQKDFPLSFLGDDFKDVPAWKRQARGKLLELLHYAPPRCDPRPEVVERADKGDYVREKVYFNTTPDIRVPAYVLVPKKGRRPLPAVVALHDHGAFYLWGKEKLVETEDEHPALAEFKKESYAGISIATALARRGYLVVAADMFYWGERRLLLDDDPADWRDRPRSMPSQRVQAFNQRAQQLGGLVGRSIAATGITWTGVMFWDDLRTVDYLLTRPEVDPNRLACVGLSVGGVRSGHLAALDDRIKAAVVVGWMTSFPTQLRRHMRHSIGDTQLVPGLYRYLDYPDAISLAMPAALLVINGSKDDLFNLDGVKASFAKLQACYQKAGIPEKFRGRLYEAPHEFNADMQAEAWAWLEKWV
jgi:dienelactone hydrolase